MPRKPGPNRTRVTMWVDRDLWRRWMDAHEPRAAAGHLARLIADELAKMEAEAGAKTPQTPPAAR